MVVRARDLRMAVQGMGFEKGVMHTLELALEELSALKQQQVQIAELVYMCINQIETMVRFGAATKDALEELKRVASQDGADG
jgi:hypothetical protein